MGKCDYLFASDDSKAEDSKTKDAGPAARRAIAGMPAGPKETADTGEGPQLDVSKRTIGGQIPGVTRGGLAMSPPSEPGKPAPIQDPTKFRQEQRAATEFEADPVAQGIASAGMTAPVAGPLFGAAAKLGAVGRTVAVPVVGAATGATTAAVAGGTTSDVKNGAITGGIMSLPIALEGIGTVLSKPSRDLGVVKDLAPYATADSRQAMRSAGYAKVADTARKYGVVGAPNPEQANAAVKAGVGAVGKEIGDVYATVGNEYARPTTGFMANVERDAQSMRGTRAGNEMADAMFDEAKRIHDLHGDTGTISLRDLRRELSDSQEAGFGGKRYEMLDEQAKAAVARRLAGHLQSELDAGISLAAKDPRFASQVSRLPDLNATYRSLKVLDETTGRMVDRAMTRRDPTLRETFSNKALGRPLPNAARPVEMPSGMRPGMKAPISTQAAISPGLAGALANQGKDPDALKSELAAQLFSRAGVTTQP